MILLSHPTGNEFVRQALVAFREAGLLREFWTTLNWNPASVVHRLLPMSIQKQLSRRSYPASVRSLTNTIPLKELGRLFAGSPGIDAVSNDLDKKVAARIRQIDNCRLIYAYEDGALESFRAAAERGFSRVYDLPIGYWRLGQRIFEEEKEREPEWSSTLTGLRDTEEKLARKDQELDLAERIIVASTFTKRTLGESKVSAKIDVIPYGAPPAVSREIRKSSGPFKVLFVGSLGQRKGLSYLLKAVRILKNSVELTLLGRKAASGCPPLDAATREHRWIPTMNHAEVLREMWNHDVLVFPSLFEGFGLVILESMAQGTPVITTEHTCGPDIIEDGVDGFIVPIRSAEAIAEKIDILASNRERLLSIKAAARQKAESHPWKLYRERLVKMAQDVIAG